MNNIGPAIDRFRATGIGAFSDRPDQYFWSLFRMPETCQDLTLLPFPTKAKDKPCLVVVLGLIVHYLLLGIF